MSFSFTTTAGASQGNVTKQLEGNEIHDVIFEGCEAIDIKGVKDPSAVYKVLKLKFANKDGVFEQTYFEPRDQDFERTETDYTDKKTGELRKIPQPSNVESMMLAFKHAIDSINPAIAKKIDDKTQNLGAADWNGLRDLVSKILNAGKGVETRIKLLKNKDGDAIFPGYFASINREGNAYIRNNFIGNNIAFTSQEMTRINNAKQAVPTKATEYEAKAPKAESKPAASAGIDETFDFPLL